MKNKYYSIKEAADILNVCEHTLYRCLRKGKIHYLNRATSIFSNTLKVIEKKELDRILEEIKKNEMKKNEYLSVKEAAEQLGVIPQTLYDAFDRKEVNYAIVKCSPFTRSVRMVEKKEVDRILEEFKKNETKKDEYLSVKKAAEQLGITSQTLYNAFERKKANYVIVKYSPFARGVKRVEKKEVDRLLKEFQKKQLV